MHLVALALVLFAGGGHRDSLTVKYWAHGQGTPAVWTLKCAPAAGTHPLKGRACVALKANAALLGPATKACTIMARRGSPTAEIAGTWAGQKVDRSYRVGCPGWDELRVVLAGA